MSRLPLLHGLSPWQCHILGGEDAAFASVWHGAFTPLPSTACETRTKGANSLSNTNNPEQTSWACSLFCGEGSTDFDPLRSHSLSHVRGLALLAIPASVSPLGPCGLESRSLAHTACDRQRRTLGRNYSKRRRAWHPALGSSLVQRFQRVSTVSTSSPPTRGRSWGSCNTGKCCPLSGDRGSRRGSVGVRCSSTQGTESVSPVEPTSSPLKLLFLPSHFLMSSDPVLQDHRDKAQPIEQTWQLSAVPGLPGQESSLQAILLQTHLGKFPMTGLGAGG